jgi:hypothetical protein
LLRHDGRIVSLAMPDDGLEGSKLDFHPFRKKASDEHEMLF